MNAVNIFHIDHADMKWKNADKQKGQKYRWHEIKT